MTQKYSYIPTLDKIFVIYNNDNDTYATIDNISSQKSKDKNEILSFFLRSIEFFNGIDKDRDRYKIIEFNINYIIIVSLPGEVNDKNKIFINDSDKLLFKFPIYCN